MRENIERLAERLYELNETLSLEKAKMWVELLWEDFESTYAKAGREYQGEQMTEQIVLRWIENYGPRLHDFLKHNEKYQKMFEQGKDNLH